MRKQIGATVLALAMACSLMADAAQVQEKLPQQPPPRRQRKSPRKKQRILQLRRKMPVQKREAERNMLSALP